MNSFTAYIAIGAILAGLAWGRKSEECGISQDVDVFEMAAVTITWPAPLAAGIFFEAEPQVRPCNQAP